MENRKKELDKNLFRPADRTEEQSDVMARKSTTLLQDAVRSLRKNVFFMISLVLLLIIVLMSIFAPVASDYTYKEQDLNRSLMGPRIPVLENISFLGLDGTQTKTFNGNNVQAAEMKAKMQFDNQEDFITFETVNEGDGSRNSAEVKATYDKYAAKGVEDEYFYFGTDRLGRDVWTRVWDGTRVSLLIAVAAALIDLVIGVAYGGIAAYYGGRVDNYMMRFLEVIIGIPNLVVVILMILILDPGIWAIIIALTITGWTSMARIVRGEVLKLKGHEFVLAARTLGAPNRKIIARHLVPNVMGLIIVNTMFSIPSAIFFEAFLSFIGLGLPSPAASLGTLINDGFKTLLTTPTLLVFPAVIISVLMIVFNILGDGLRDAFDPKMRK
ncbi:oligopeptide transport system permease protein [Terribacillus saccharophilus]|uniref:Oligopeptide transport system permease protein n=1 Tax=Terribacillus saccharophilus TaxID=361277 RepID=A0A075LHC4_9BACI|nr:MULTISPECIES: oligopeptide ABC transporter permease [Terribacillus]AIF66075.1 peptide ABC transporter permease [Terribacillus goriensis]MCM3226839.1 ABC transporter permease [Terribacillus saccharophilus]SEM88928.1 oligopeptide transport system permease protein [Terribacillus saccharophilus]